MWFICVLCHEWCAESLECWPKLSRAYITSSILFSSMHSRNVFNRILTRLSSASRCACHSIGAAGSEAIDSRINWDNGFGPVWKLKNWIKQTNKWKVCRRNRNTQFNWCVQLMTPTLKVFSMWTIESRNIVKWIANLALHRKMVVQILYLQTSQCPRTNKN